MYSDALRKIMQKDKSRQMLAQDTLGEGTHDGDEYSMPDVAPSLQDDQLGEGTMGQHNYGEPKMSGIMGVVEDTPRRGAVEFEDENFFEKIMKLLGAQ